VDLPLNETVKVALKLDRAETIVPKRERSDPSLGLKGY
jgi:hypothetical protein